ncbi:MAG TPA: flavoprotein [Pirellulaceae bacterium]
MRQPEVLIGVAGGIAAYKTATVVSRLVQATCGVSVILTPSAETLVGRATFAALTGRVVGTETIDPDHFPLGAHIELARRAEILCIAPATANVLAKLAQGLADDLLGSAYLCFRGPVLVAPAMNSEMWQKAAVQRNIAQLRQDGVQIIEPESGWLSCREVGAGRMAEPEQIVADILAHLKR